MFSESTMKLLANIVVAIIIGSVSQAQAASFKFSFQNINGPVNGTVEGLITLPDGDGSFSASQVDILAYPAALGLGQAPINAMAGGTSGNLFTVSGGQITSSDFVGLINSYTALGLNSSLANSSYGVYTFLDTLNGIDAGLTGVRDNTSSTLTYTSPTPIPGPAPLLGAFAAFGFCRKLRRKVAVSR
jgi:hypothetical protein